MMSVIFGFAALAAGTYGMYLWRHDLLQFLRGFGPLSVALAGIVAILVGLANRSPSRKSSVLSKDA